MICLFFFSNPSWGETKRTDDQIEIIFPVASEAMTATGESGEGSVQVVPGVSGM